MQVRPVVERRTRKYSQSNSAPHLAEPVSNRRDTIRRLPAEQAKIPLLALAVLVRDHREVPAHARTAHASGLAVAVVAAVCTLFSEWDGSCRAICQRRDSDLDEMQQVKRLLLTEFSAAVATSADKSNNPIALVPCFFSRV